MDKQEKLRVCHNDAMVLGNAKLLTQPLKATQPPGNWKCGGVTQTQTVCLSPGKPQPWKSEIILPLPQGKRITLIWQQIMSKVE